MSHPLYTNRLIREKSPYLLQHAHNPVDWYPWSEEAFQAAREQDKPIFLSIGYASCHWCHVMEGESFQNWEVARLMNESCINIKVDREEKPEIDSLYMEFAQAMMPGGAGWPLNVLLTPDLLPFFAATYLPADENRGFLGLKQLLLRIHQIWRDPEERENVISQAGKIVDLFATHVHISGTALPRKEEIKEAAELLYKSADPLYGGTKGAPKFPVGVQALFLLHLVRETAESRALFYVEKTLDMMHRGGLYDHLGGGFSRYSIDEKWLIPHFEKMLYDNAILARTYLEAWQYTKRELYKEVAEEILNYVLNEMTHPLGGFYSAEDADSEGHEGRFYTWSWEEVHAHLGSDSTLFCDYYGITPMGNFEGRSVLHITQTFDEFCAERRLDPKRFKIALHAMRRTLWEIRNQRPHPLKDDKIITAWNGLMIYTYAEAGRLLREPKYLEMAQKAAGFIRERLWNEESLLRRWRDQDARFDGCLDDYACMIHGLLTLFEADRGTQWLEWALVLTQILKRDFKAEGGAFYLTNGKDPHVILRRCEFYDGAEPSGNAIHAENLLRIYQLTGQEDYLKDAEDILKAAQEHIALYPPGTCYHLKALLRYYAPKAATLVIALNEKEHLREELANLLASHFLPQITTIWKRVFDEELRDLLALSRGKEPIEGKTTLYLCHKGQCQEPITEWSHMVECITKL